MALDYKNSLSRYRRYLQVSHKQPWVQASLYTVLTLGLVIVLLVSALKPTLITIAGLLGQIKQDQEIEKRLDEKIVVVQKASEELRLVEPRLEIVDRAIPEDVEWSDFVNQIQQTASSSGLLLGSFTLNPNQAAGESESDLASWTFSLSGEGDYAAVKAFMGDLAKMRRLSVIGGVDILKRTEGGVTINVSGAISYLPSNHEEIK
ncbi:MAG: Uncharacterized protein G01um101416_809 [Microgenomates group bacterium Gr01-1014_16]|nr:MAG: Uncharacterized protein G01um101416_809 [Microgenomates group bacterium Gr01-1014_16]